ncbi:response regulator transcription factor [Lysobacter capsici]|uniref:response regulator transcription factor n=1 Tax=Lysobacter capsici TaxID=435897 RepID=UPI00287BB11D|nr:response regulator transcription factor [Lysobacter capsici]WND80445.1 response regulator transcription factor [Lysobacter capsici]WND85642.1 response regulator transcription factor [Lysobacter capsici]
MIRIFVVDDHPLLRIGLRWLLEAQGDIQVIGEAGSVADAMIMIPAAGPDLVLCDFHLPDGDGLDVVQRLLQELPKLRILVVSVLEGGPIPRRLLAAGALGYVSKARDGATLLRAVREVAAGHRFLDEALAASILFEPSPFDRLSPRELEVARMMIRGEKTPGIAEALGITESTIRTFRARVLSKLEVRSEISLIRLAMDCGFEK